MINKRCKTCGCFIGKNTHSCTYIRKKQSESHKGKRLTKEHKLKIKLKNIGNKKTKEDREGCRERMINRIQEGKIKIARGEAHWNWKGGISSFNRLLRESSKYKIWRELVFLRDNFTCQKTNCEFCNNKIRVILHSHHIKPLALYPELAYDVNNGITYCAEYHIKSNLHIGIQKSLMQKEN